MRPDVIKEMLKWLVVNIPLRIYNFVGRCYLSPILRYEWRKSQTRQPNERPVEYGYALNWLAHAAPTEILDVGAGRSSWPHLLANCYFRVTAIDRIKGYWKGGYFNRHYRVINDDITNPKTDRKFDAITCLSVLEHIPDHRTAVRGMLELLRPGGHLILSFPYNERSYIDNVYKRPGAGYGQDYSYICQVFSRNEIDGWISDDSGKIIDQQYYEVFTGEFWTYGDRVYHCKRVERDQRCHLTCMVIQKT
jgi:SAM-dependent methyltransferase